MSNFAQCGSHSSASSAGHDNSTPIFYLPLNTSSRSSEPTDNQSLSRMRSISDAMRSWLGSDHQHERIATSTPRVGVAVLTRSLIDTHSQSAPTVRGMQDYLPVAHKKNAEWVGWRQKLGTWEAPKSRAVTAW